MDFRVVAVCSLGDGSGIHTKKKKRVFIHSNSTGFVKLLLSICHHKSHFDLAFLGAVLPAQFCLLILHRTPRKFRGPIRNTEKKPETTLHRKRKEKANPLGFASQGGTDTDNNDTKHARSTLQLLLPGTLQHCQVCTITILILQLRNWTGDVK